MKKQIQSEDVMQTNATERITDCSYDLTIAFCFLAGGMAMLSWGYILFGGVCLFAAMVWPTFSMLLSHYQRTYADRERELQDSEFEQLRELARSELELLRKNE